MSELKKIVENIQSVFSENNYPQQFLDVYDQMECLASHTGRETFLVRKKSNGIIAVAKCYDRAVFPFQPNPELFTDIEHPGLPRLFEQYQNEQILCIVREYIEGEPLNEYVKEGQLSIQQICSFGKQLCEILSVLHHHTPPVIHRDIKPENIIIKPDMSLALIDFDISRFYKQNAEQDTIFFGTKGYAPPEQYGFGQTDSRTDIYALGILFRWLVTGSTKENSNISMDERLQKIIDRCTAFSPEDRYSDTEQILRDLNKTMRHRQPIKIRKILAFTVLALGFLCCGFVLGRCTDWLRPVPVIIFSEPVIEKAARVQLDKQNGQLTQEDLQQVRCIYIFGDDTYADADEFYRQSYDQHTEGSIRTLDDLKWMPNLEEIHIHRQGHVDISGLSDLVHVHTVDLKHMHISGLQPVAHITRLKHAILFDCGLTDVSALENCPWLETLDIGRNDLTDLKQVGSHPNVRSLGFMWLNMKKLDDIAQHFPKLQAITLQHGTIKDMSGLRELINLETVYVLSEQYESVAGLFEGTDVEIRTTEN